MNCIVWPIISLKKTSHSPSSFLVKCSELQRGRGPIRAPLQAVTQCWGLITLNQKAFLPSEHLTKNHVKGYELKKKIQKRLWPKRTTRKLDRPSRAFLIFDFLCILWFPCLTWMCDAYAARRTHPKRKWTRLYTWIILILFLKLLIIKTIVRELFERYLSQSKMNLHERCRIINYKVYLLDEEKLDWKKGLSQLRIRVCLWVQ